MSAHCGHCDNTGSLSRDFDGALDCAHCPIAAERTALERWLQRHLPSMHNAGEWLIAWQLYLHGKAAAMAEVELARIGAEIRQKSGERAAAQVHVHTCSNVSLTSTQHYVLLFIKACISSQGRPPTRQDIATHFKWKSPNAADDHLRRLVAKGFIVIHPGRACGIEVVAQTGQGQ